MPRRASLHLRQLFTGNGWIENARIGILDGLCETLETNTEPRPEDERHAVAFPGVPNLHSHAFQRGMAGMTERRGPTNDSFWTWREIMYRFVDALTPDDLRDIAAMAYVEMLETGFTRVGEFHYLHRDAAGQAFDDPARMGAAIIEAAAGTGIALSLLPVFYAHAGFGGTAPGIGQRRFVHDIDGFARLHERARTLADALPDAVVGIAPHSLRAVTPTELDALIRLAGEAPIHIHVAEQVREVEDCVAWCGARPVEWLLDHAPVDARWCLVHATHMTDGETVALARTGAVAGLCPITEANLGDGLFNAEPYLASGGRFGIGSDSNVLIDASEELRLLEYGQRLVRRGRNIFRREPGDATGRILLEASIAGGARALGVAAGFGIGRPVDLVSLDAEHPSLAGKRADDLLGCWLFAGGRSVIDCVWRRGEKVVSKGRHRRRHAVEARYRDVVRRLL